ncbi:ATP-binding protein [Pseudomonas sp. GD04058]|uniref:sensor histidine kinase n=1 Tax=Pseudomonas sp. GD04058 TaxID=2975429 RepID=UPI0024478EFA|nr:ATP-binding protein [Pseudomonas sp. GD04058]MDG9882444.1 ATP-binding protein [Pseudomonas sp. GD04058]
MRQLWPRSLQGRLVLILVGGMLVSQLLTSSIWHEVRQTQVLEIPLRLAAGRIADVLQVARQHPQQLEAVLDGFESSRWQRLEEVPDQADIDPLYETLLRRLVAERLGQPASIHVLGLELLAANDTPAGPSTLFDGEQARVRLRFSMHIPDGRTLYFQATESQGWSSGSISSLVFDYILRIYLVRILAVVLVALLAVRLALRPLKQMAAAAEALGRDIHRPPLSLDGPQEVRQAAQAFNAMQRRLIDSIAERTRFFAAVSHDLRTPITRMRLRAEMLPEEHLRQRFRDDLGHMQEMVTASLDFLRNAELEPAREPVAIDALLQGLQADFEDLGGELRIHGSARPLLAHPGGLRRCLQNLLDNARRHAPGPVDIEVVDEAQRLLIKVGDRGPGIGAEHRRRVFEHFYQVDPSRSSGGHGLGLSIAANIARGHGGSLEMAERQGGGLWVILELPR